MNIKNSLLDCKTWPRKGKTNGSKIKNLKEGVNQKEENANVDEHVYYK